MRLSLPILVIASILCSIYACVGVEPRGNEKRLYLVISNNDRLLTKELVHSGQSITIMYNHSVLRIPVLEVFEVKGEGPLYLSELISLEPLLSYPGYEHYYSNRLPWDGQSKGPLPIDLDINQREWFIVKGIDRAGVMPLMVGSCFVDHKILVGSKIINLRQVAGSGKIVEIMIKEK